MAEIEAETQGVDGGFNFTGSYDAIALGEIAEAKAREFMRKLPDEEGVPPALEQGDDLCPPCIHLRFEKAVKKGFLIKRMVHDAFILTLIGGQEKGKVLVSEDFADLGVVPFSEADEVIRHFYEKAAKETTSPAGF